MNNFDASDAAFTIMSEASEGSDISRRYNALSSSEQKQVFSQMQGLKSSQDTMKLFGDVEIVDNNGDGILDRAYNIEADGSKATIYTDSKIEDLFPNKKPAAEPYLGTGIGIDPQTAFSKELLKNGLVSAEKSNFDSKHLHLASAADQPSAQQDGNEKPFAPLTQREILQDPYLRQADNMLRQASRGYDIQGLYSRSGNGSQMLEAMKAVQASNPEYGNVKLVDQNGDGMLDDARALVPDRRTGEMREVDVFKTSQDHRNERVQRQAENTARRGGEIVLDEVFNGMRRGSNRGPSTGERIFDRAKRESTNGAHNILRDILRGR